jgi:hypothetical protein
MSEKDEDEVYHDRNVVGWMLDKRENEEERRI